MFRLLHILFLFILCILPSSCGKKSGGDGTSNGEKSSQIPGLPAQAAQDAPHFISLNLTGGKFDADEVIKVAFSPPTGTMTMLDQGLRVSIEPEKPKNYNSPAPWAIHIFADGPLIEEQELRLRTGSEIRLNGISYSPMSDPKKSPTATGHWLDAILKVVVIDPSNKNLEMEIHGNFVAPDGKEPVKIDGLLRLPLN